MDTARQLRAKGMNVTCQILGFLDVANPSAVSRSEMDAWVVEGVLEYLGSTTDVRPFIAQADAVVLPSYREGTPRTLLVAAAMARSIIATYVSGCREVVVDQVNGLFCEVLSAASLATCMKTMQDSDEAILEAMPKAGRAFVENRLDERLVL